MKKNVIAFDFGASSGRAIIGKYNHGNLELEEVHRFVNEPITKNGMLYWNIDDLFEQIKTGIRKATDKYEIDSLGIDTWGVDYGLLDENGTLLGSPIHYRDVRTKDAVKKFSQLISEDELYEMSGIQIMEINTMFQLLIEKNEHSKRFEKAKTMLLMPDLMNYLLTGVVKSEMSIASTTGMLNPITKTWNWSLIEKLGLPVHIFKEITEEGQMLGVIKPELELPSLPVFNVCSHDTASAVVSVPNDENCLFVSCGTWSLIGCELDYPVINEKSKKYNLTNESGVNKTTRLLKNLTGLWIIQELKRDYQSNGKIYSYIDFERLARDTKQITSFIDTEDESFKTPGNMANKILNYIQKTEQTLPTTDGELIRLVYESLAFKYRQTFLEIMDTTDVVFDTINIFGGGCQSELLCEMVANVSDLKVIAGPVEATAIGNIAIQLIKHQAINSLEEARMWIGNNTNAQTYHPQNHHTYKVRYTNYQNMLKMVSHD